MNSTARERATASHEVRTVLLLLLCLAMLLVSACTRIENLQGGGFGASMVEGQTQESMNRELLDLLKSAGDDASRPRLVDFAAWFPTAEARSAFVREITAEGFSHAPEGVWQDDDARFWCAIAKTTAVQLEIITQETTYLSSVAVKYGGGFDGWSSPIVK